MQLLRQSIQHPDLLTVLKQVGNATTTALCEDALLTARCPLIVEPCKVRLP